MVEEWAAIFDLMSDGVSIHDKEFTILNANLALCRMVNKTREEIIGQKCYRIFHGTDAPIGDCVFEKTCETRGHTTSELFEPWINAWISVTSSPILDEARTCTRTIHIVRDVTDRKKAEEERDLLMIEHMEALSLANTLKSLLPICAGCKKIRRDDGIWEPIDTYIHNKTGTEFSHGLCPSCVKKIYPGIKAMKLETDKKKE